MALDQKFFKKSTTASGLTNQEQGLVLHLDANDVDSYDGDGSIWYDITKHEVNVPLTDNDDNLEIHIDASNTNSYPGYGSTITDISTNGHSFSTHGNATFGSDLRGYFTLDGSDDDLRTTNAVTGFSGDVTFEWWFNASESNNFALLHANPLSNDTGINGIFIGNAGGGAGAIEIYRRTTGGTLHSGQTSSTGLSGMASDGWVHFVITITSANVCKFYKDGTYKGTLTLNGNGTNHDTYNFVSIGGYNSASYEFAGQMGCFRMYSEILTAAEIGQNFRAGNFLNYSSIITSKHDATQNTLYTTNLNLSLDANGYSGSGDWQDGTNNNDGVIYGPTYTDDGSSDYFDFDGSNDYITVAGSDLNPANTKCIELWFNTDSTAEQYIVSNNNGSGAYGYHMGITSQKLFMWIYSQEQGHYHVNTSTGSSNTAAITTGEWNHAVWTMGPNASDNKIYLNGNLAYTHSSMGGGTFPSTAAYNGINIGKYTSSGWFNGKLAQVRAYSTALTPSQINTNYNATKALYRNPTALIDYRPDQYSGSGTSITNLGSLSNNAVLTGGIESTYDKELGDFFTIDGSSNSGDGIETTSNVTGVNLNTDGFSWELWINIAADSYSYIASFNYSSTYYNFSYRSNTDTIMFFNLGTILNTPTLQLNRWYHVVGTANSAGTKLYTDGVLSASNTTAAPNYNLDDKIYFGTYHSHSSADHIHTGPLGDARFYKGALTAEQVAQNYLATKNKYPNGINFTGSNISWNANGYFSFNGSNANFGTSGAPSALINATGFTVSAWIWRTNSVTGTNTIFTNCHDNGNSGQNWILSMTGSGTVHFHIYGTDNYAGVADLVSYETWTHLAGVVEFDGVKRIYKNGVVQLSTSAGYSADTVSTYNTFIGSLGSYGNYHDGRIGAVKYYKKPLTADELLADYNSTKGTYGL